MRSISSSTFVPGLAVVACALAVSCHNRGNAVLNVLGPTSTGLGNHAAYVDLDRSGTVNQGDELWMRFDRALALGFGVEEAFELPVQGDALGGPEVDLANSPGLVRVVLGPMSGLRARGIHSGALSPGNLPSGLRVAEDAPSGALVAADTGFNAIRGGLALDVVPEFREGETRISDAHVATADLDCDGDLDLVTVREGMGSTLTVELQGIDGSYSVQAQTGVGDVNALLLLDANQDGRTDVVVAQASGTVQVFQNLASGSAGIDLQLANSFDLGTQGEPLSLATTDANMDGDPDLWIGTSSELVLARGALDFGFEAPLPVGAPEGEYSVLAFGDLDSNGTQDAFAGGASGDRILLFGFNAQLDETVERGGSGLPITWAADVGDLNSDGRPDVVMGTEEAVIFWRQTPLGFSELIFESVATNAPTRDLRAIDIDGDSSLDVVRLGADAIEVLGGDGLGAFTRSPRELSVDEATGMAIGDFDNDRDLDAVVSGATSGWWYGSSRGTFGTSTYGPEAIPTSADEFPGLGQTLDVIHGDLDGDGDIDAVTSLVTASGGEVRTWNNMGAGNMLLSQTLPIGLDRAEALALADFDSDGDLDIFAASVGDSCHLWLADPAGQYPAESTPVAVGSQGSGLGLGDIDNDGDIDIVLGTVRLAPNRILLNGGRASARLGDGGGSFWAGFDDELPFSNPQHTNEILLHDLDCDGDLDMVMAHGPGGLDTVWRNTLDEGALGFQQVLLAALDGITAPTVAVRTRDVNLDGNLDLILGNRPGVRVYFGDGELEPGSYALGFIVPGGSVTAMDLGDTDGDGFDDLVLGSTVEARVRIHRGLPGSFQNSAVQTIPFGSVSSVSLGDRSGNGAADLLVGERNMDLPNGAYRNR